MVASQGALFANRRNVSTVRHDATLFGGFVVDGLVRSRSALPVNLLTNKDPFGIGVKTMSRPDAIPGAPLLPG